MLIPEWLNVVGDVNFRGKCSKEDADLGTFFNQIRKRYPDTYGIFAMHPKTEGKRKAGDFKKEQSKGVVAGASDIIIVGCPALVMELKRKDHTKSSWEPKQLPFMKAAHDSGAHVVLALGWEAALQAFDEWEKINKKRIQIVDSSQLF